jgi:hypothetical protein
VKKFVFWITLSGLGVMTSVASAQTLLNDGFDSYGNGNVNGQGGWFTSNTSFNVINGGGSLPTPTSGTKMLASNGLNTNAGNFIQPAWNARTSGNDILIVEADLYIPSTDTSGRSLNCGISGNTGNMLCDIGYTTSGNQFFIFSTVSGFGATVSGSRNAWHHLKFQLDFNAKTTDLFVDSGLLGTVAFGPTEGINSIFLNSVSGATPPEAYWDSFKASAVSTVPEPTSLGAIALGFGVFVVRRRKSAITSSN